jgi:cyclic-di-GMP-binding protein
MPSFDATSEIDNHELTNAVDQANRELEQRFDFRGVGASFSREEKEPFVVLMKAQAEFQLKQMLDILRLRLSKRGIDVNCMEVKDIDKNLGGTRQKVILKHGIDADSGRKIVKLLKESGLKVQAQIQGDKVRVTGKKRDDLQEAIAHLRAADVGVPLQFENFRD